MLEQSGHCMLRQSPPQVRKFAFYHIMAGHRYSKCGQRKHAFRCYRLASIFYRDRMWSFADDHIFFSLARQAFHLQNYEGAVEYFAKLFKPESKQSATNHAAYIREFAYTLRVHRFFRLHQIMLEDVS